MKTRLMQAGIVAALTMSTGSADPGAARARTGHARTPLTSIQRTDALYDLARGFLPKPLVRAGYSSSYDRRGANDDGFQGRYSALYRLANGEHVIVDLEGPGCLYTLWFTGPAKGARLPWGRLRFYLDGEETARHETTFRDLFTGDSPAFPRPLVADSYTSTGGNVCHVPVTFQKRLIITTEKPVEFYNAFCHLYPHGTRVQSWTGRQNLSPVIEAWNAAGSEPRQATEANWHRGVTAVPGSRSGGPMESRVILDRESAGIVTALRINPVRLGPRAAAAVLNNLWLRIWWDDEESPSVDVPVGPFFGTGQGQAAVRSLPIGMSPSGPCYCYFPMPFQKAARIVLENRQPEPTGNIYYEVAVTEPGGDEQARRRGRFHAVYRQEQPTTSGRDYTILDLEHGQGLFLGHTLIVRPDSADQKGWWEGDLRIWTDQRRHLILHGTGHEDEFLGGWSSRWLQNAYSLPLHGLPAIELFEERPDRKRNGAITAYRFFAGGIPFRDGIRVTTEHGEVNTVLANYASVAYYYASGQAGMRLTDSLEVGNTASERDHHYRAEGGEATGQMTAHFDGFEGLPGLKPLTDAGRRGQSSETFTLEIDPENRGVLLRRLYLQSEGRHRARVTLDRTPIGFCSAPDDNRVDRWRENDLILPPALTAGKDRITMHVEAELGTWNAFCYQAWSLAG